MLVLVTGGSGSGKSAYAEMRAMELSQGGRRLVYLATMYNDPQDAETAARIARHRKMREGKGFRTVEQPSYIESADVQKEDTVLLEDLPNLLANELYGEWNEDPADIKTGNTCPEDGKREENIGTDIAASLKILAARCENLVIVTGILDCDGQKYDHYTMSYIHALSAINADIAKNADEVTEVIAGIPVLVKGTKTGKTQLLRT